MGEYVTHFGLMHFFSFFFFSNGSQEEVVERKKSVEERKNSKSTLGPGPLSYRKDEENQLTIQSW